MSIPSFNILCVDNKYIISVKPNKSKERFWCWSYKNRETSEHVINCITERWLNCPVQKFEDYSIVFVEKLEDILFSNIEKSEIDKDWKDTPSKKIDIKKISGY